MGDSGELRRDAIVRLVGLQESPNLNGTLGTLLHFNDEKERWLVRLNEDASNVLVRPANMELVTSGLDGTMSAQEEHSPCSVCLEAPAVMAFIPCGHRCICLACGVKLHGEVLSRCPQCRCAATDLVRIFT